MSVIGVGLGLGSLALQHKGQKDAKKAQERALDQATTTLNSIGFMGPGGLGVGITPIFEDIPAASSGQSLALPPELMASSQVGGGDLTLGGGLPFKAPQSIQDGLRKKIAEQGGEGGLFKNAPQLVQDSLKSHFGDSNTILGQLLQKEQGGGANQPTRRQVGENVTIGLGQLEPARHSLTNFAKKQFGQAHLGQSLPQNVALATAFASQNRGIPGADLAGLDAISSQLGSEFGANIGDLAGARNPFQAALQNALFGGANQQAQLAGTGFGDVRADTLATLREQARPFEERQLAQLQNQQFAQGRLGTTGGALQTEAFARGLGQADLDRQLRATQEARATQAQALQSALGLSQAGGGVRSLQDDLLNSAFGRFAQTAQLGEGLDRTRFGRVLGLNELGFNRAQAELANQIRNAQLIPQLQGQRLGLGLQALQGQAGLQSQALEGFQAALALAQARANAEVGAGSNIAQIAGSRNFNSGGGAELGAQVLAGMAGRLADRAPEGGLLNTLFGTGGA